MRRATGPAAPSGRKRLRTCPGQDSALAKESATTIEWSDNPDEGRARRLAIAPQRGWTEQSDQGNLLGDLRFRALVRDDEWALLPLAIRRRFTQRLAAGNTIVFSGQVVATSLTRRGWWWAQAARLIGGPLPTGTDAQVPSVVTVTEDMAKDGQIWTRLYARRSGFPQVIHSSKRFAGPTGLEEYVGYGISMSLTVHVHAGALVFRSYDYYLQIFGRRLRLPRWLTPGTLSVTHAELGDGWFGYTLDIRHERFGTLIHQSASFRETEQWIPPCSA
jgi:hypothetical protein